MSSGGTPHAATKVVASLLRQLCLLFHIVPRHLERLYERSDRGPDIQLELDDMLEAMREISRDINQPIVIIMDGLDECNMCQQKDFVKMITCLKKTSWKFLVTSRFGENILFKACRGCSQLSIKEGNVENDIRTLVDSALGWSEPVHDLLSNRAFRLEVTETLVSRAHGM